MLDPYEDGYERLTPLDPAQALAWMEKQSSADQIGAEFGPLPEAAQMRFPL